jgi:hypothetical protein
VGLLNIHSRGDVALPFTHGAPLGPRALDRSNTC